MTKPLPLDERVIAVLTQHCTSEAAQSVLDAALAALRDLSAKADAADLASLNPLAPAREALAHRSRAGDLRFEADRLDASVQALRERVDELQSAEEEQQRLEHRAAVLAARDALAIDIATAYPRIVLELTSLAKRITESDAACAAIGINESAEARGRGVPASFYLRGSPVGRITQMVVPMPSSERPAWHVSNEDFAMVWHGLTAAGSGVAAEGEAA